MLEWPDDCESAFEASSASDDPGVTVFELTPRLSLVRVLCAAGSYQPSFIYVQLDERRTPISHLTLAFPVYESEDGSSVTMTDSHEVWGESTVRVDARELTVMNIVRQTGDCGIWTRYRLDDEGRSASVVEARAQLPCPTRPRNPAVSEAGQPPKGWKPLRPPVSGAKP